MFKLLLISAALCAIGYGATLQQRELVPMLAGGRIVGGQPTTIEENPWQVSMRHFGSHRCGGSIVSPTKIVTAAHCIRSTFIYFVDVRVGSASVQDGGQTIDVTRMHIHEEYNIPVKFNNDIGLLFLENALEFGPTIQPIGLPKQGERISVGDVAIISGWGALTEGGQISNQLQAVAVLIIDDDICDRANGIQKDTMFCAGNYEEGGVGSCNGDSGGPLRINGVLQGVVSGGYGCARPKFPGVLTRLATYRDWIDRHN